MYRLIANSNTIRYPESHDIGKTAAEAVQFLTDSDSHDCDASPPAWFSSRKDLESFGNLHEFALAVEADEDTSTEAFGLTEELADSVIALLRDGTAFGQHDVNGCSLQVQPWTSYEDVCEDYLANFGGDWMVIITD